MVRSLDAQRAAPKRWTLSDAPSVAPVVEGDKHGNSERSPGLVVLVRDLAQLEAVAGLPVDTVYCELEDPKGYRVAVERFRALRPGEASERGSLFVVPPRIFKPGEEWILKIVHSCEADGYLVRNYDHLRWFATDRIVGDFSLNIANPLAAEHFMKQHGLECLTASYDLNFEQLAALVQSSHPEWFEVTIHQHMPMFHMEHCVFCAFLSKGKDYRDCGRPCDRHDVRLRDRVGSEHPLKADAGCRNTLFNALAQTGAEYVQRLIALGVRRFRLEFLRETPETVIKTVEMYQRLLRGEITGADLWRELKLKHQLGVTRGQMEREETLFS